MQLLVYAVCLLALVVVPFVTGVSTAQNACKLKQAEIQIAADKRYKERVEYAQRIERKLGEELAVLKAQRDALSQRVDHVVQHDHMDDYRLSADGVRVINEVIGSWSPLDVDRTVRNARSSR